jgi:hypothetical protein
VIQRNRTINVCIGSVSQHHQFGNTLDENCQPKQGVYEDPKNMGTVERRNAEWRPMFWILVDKGGN